MTEHKEFRRKRAADNVVRIAVEWSRAHQAWRAYDGDAREDDRLYEAQKSLHIRLEAAAHELAAIEDER